MRSPFAVRLGAWLCLAGALCLGLVPGGALILCLGPEGTVALEGRPADGACGGCPELDGDEPVAGVSDARVEDAGECPCTDVLVGQPSAESKTKPKRVELEGSRLVAVPIACAPRPGADRVSPLAPVADPLVDPALALIESVVLRL